MKFSLLKTAVACAAAVVVSPQLAFSQSAWNVGNVCPIALLFYLSMPQQLSALQMSGLIALSAYD